MEDKKNTCCCEEKKETEKAKSCCAPPTAETCCCGGGEEKSPCCEGEKSACCGGDDSPCCAAADGVKKILTILLLFFVVGSIGFVVFKEMKSPPTTLDTAQSPLSSDTLVIYYFHGTQRCSTCDKIEAQTKATIEANFPNELASGAIVFKSVDFDVPTNKHFLTDFALTSGTVVMQRHGKYEKFDAVWTLVGDPEKFADYIRNGANKF